jgi:2-C-methyl-D-erythritol 4-phosphate cytidylyltransferase
LASADNAAIIVAAGRSERMAGDDKLWAPIAGPDGRARPLLAYAVAAFETCPAIARIVLVVAEDKLPQARALVEEHHFGKVGCVVAGGARRQDSVRAGLDAIGACDYVIIHDGARPLVTPHLIEEALATARETGASCCAIAAPDTVKEVADGYIARTVDRSRLMLAQTPQAFRYDLLVDAHKRSTSDATDDAALVEALGVRVRIAPGSTRNIKVTTPEDLALVRWLISRSP